MRIVQPVIEQLKAQSHPVCHYIYDLDELEVTCNILHRHCSVIVRCTYAMKANMNEQS